MLGAIFGDICGSVYEAHNTHEYDFPLLTAHSHPTDDSIMTLAVAEALMKSIGSSDEKVRTAMIEEMRRLGRMYPRAGYGPQFARWLCASDPKPYGSYGNGAAMRVSSAGWLFGTMEETLHYARLSAEVTHNHTEGIKGAQAAAAAIFLARGCHDKDFIMNWLHEHFGYDLSFTLAEIRPGVDFDMSCQGTVPAAFRAFYEGKDYEDVIRLAVSLGGDSDTLACIAGGIAEAYYGMPEAYRREALQRLDQPLKDIAQRWHAFYQEHHIRARIDLPQDPSLRYGRDVEEAVHAVYEGKENEMTRLPVWMALSRLMRHDGHVILTGRQNQGMMQFGVLYGPDGSSALAAFTSQEKMLRSRMAEGNMISLFLDQIITEVLKDETLEGIMLNPDDESWFLDKRILSVLIEEYEKDRDE
jgi:ADP-ribosylglycohydrolase